MRSPLTIIYNQLRHTYRLLDREGRVLFESYTLAEVKQYREELINE